MGKDGEYLRVGGRFREYADTEPESNTASSESTEQVEPDTPNPESTERVDIRETKITQLEGLVHDWNHMATQTGFLIKLMQSDLGPLAEEGEGDPRIIRTLEHLATVDSGMDHIREMIFTHLRTGHNESDMNYLSIADVVRSSYNLCAAQIPKVIKKALHMNTAKSIHANGSQMHRLLNNLMVNATYAVQESFRQGNKDPSITVDVSEKVVEGKISSIDGSELPTGHYVVLSVIDNGPGFPKGDIAKYFERKVTTKGDNGDGLGLYNVKKIARNHGAYIVVPQSDIGATIKVYLPRQHTDERPILSEGPLEDRDDYSILVIDVNSNVRGDVRDILGPLGYDVYEANSLESAIDKYKGKSPDVVVVDLFTAEMTAEELYEHVKTTYGQGTGVFILHGAEESGRVAGLKESGLIEAFFTPVTDPRNLQASVQRRLRKK